MEHSVDWAVEPDSFLRKRAHMSLSAAGRLKKKLLETPAVLPFPDIESFVAVQPLHGQEAKAAIDALLQATNTDEAVYAINRIVQLNRPLAQ